jgi:hypothetical protein
MGWFYSSEFIQVHILTCQQFSQGLGFVHKVVKEDSQENKKALLESAYKAKHAWLYDAICDAWD